MNLRTHVQPGDLGRIVALHGTLYAAEHGLEATFEAYVAGTLGHFARPWDATRERLWLAEQADELVGCAGLIQASATQAQFRWLLVAPSARGQGLGTRLLREAIAFAEAAGYAEIFLDTIAELPEAARLYESAGFRCIATQPTVPMWGRLVTEQRYALRLPRERSG
jgi:GNAT superfamily N-acetyltransferase